MPTCCRWASSAKLVGSSGFVVAQIFSGSSSLPLRKRKRYGLFVTVRYGASVPFAVHTARYGGFGRAGGR